MYVCVCTYEFFAGTFEVSYIFIVFFNGNGNEAGVIKVNTKKNQVKCRSKKKKVEKCIVSLNIRVSLIATIFTWL